MNRISLTIADLWMVKSQFLPVPSLFLVPPKTAETPGLARTRSEHWPRSQRRKSRGWRPRAAAAGGGEKVVPGLGKAWGKQGVSSHGDFQPWGYRYMDGL